MNQSSAPAHIRAFFAFCALLLVAALAAACASGSSGDGATSSRNVITQAEIAELPPGDGWEVVQRLRPRWLRQRGIGGMARCRIDGRIVPEGDTENALRSVRAQDISEIRFLEARDATTLYGTGFPAGLIDVSTRG